MQGKVWKAWNTFGNCVEGRWRLMKPYSVLAWVLGYVRKNKVECEWRYFDDFKTQI
jgi:hypothetical protein